MLRAWGERTFDNGRRGRVELFGNQNMRKRYAGYIAALLDPETWCAIKIREKKLLDAISRDPKLRSTLSAYDRIKKAQAELVKSAQRYDFLEQERPISVG